MVQSAQFFGKGSTRTDQGRSLHAARIFSRRKAMRRYMRKKNIDPCTALTAVLAVVIFLFNIRNIGALYGPHIFDDELGYLAHAASFAGLDWHEVMRHSNWYSYGWSLVLAPLFFLFSDMTVIYRCVNVINALLIAAVFLMQRRLLRGWFKTADGFLVTAVSACVCFYPSVLIHACIAWSETWVLFIFTAVTLLLQQILQEAKVSRVVLFGALLNYLYICHNRMLPVLITGVIIFAILFFKKKINGKLLAIFIATFVVFAVAFRIFNRVAISITWKGEAPTGNSAGAVFERLWPLSVKVVLNFLGVLCCQSFNMCISSFGIVPVGLFYMFRRIVQKARARSIQDAAMEIWFTLSFCGVLAVSAMFMGMRQDISRLRIDNIFYGRYVEPLTIIMIGYGLLRMLSDKEEATGRSYMPAYMFTVAVCALAARCTVKSVAEPLFHRINAPGLSPYVNGFFPDFVFAAAFFGILGFYAIWRSMRSRRAVSYIAMTLLAVFGIVNAGFPIRDIVGVQSRYREESELIDTIENYDVGECPVYVLDNGNWQSFFQSMLMDMTLKYDRDHTLETIPDEEYYAIVTLEDYAGQSAGVDSRIVAESVDNAFIHVTHKNIEADTVS